MESEVKLLINGKGLDGRGMNDFRPIEIDIAPVSSAVGSAVFKFGNTYSLAAVYGPKPFHPKALQDPLKAIMKCKYNMAPFSTWERIRPGNSRRSTEISMVIDQALENVAMLEDFPRTGVDVFMEILEADASTRCAALNAASMALADAGIPMRDLVSSCSVGMINGHLALDMAGKEDTEGDVDMAVAVVGREDKFVLLQMDGVISKEEFTKLLHMAKEGCHRIHDMQKKALQEKYGVGETNVEG